MLFALAGHVDVTWRKRGLCGSEIKTGAAPSRWNTIEGVKGKHNQQAGGEVLRSGEASFVGVWDLDPETFEYEHGRPRQAGEL